MGLETHERTADASKAAVDEETRRELYREYGLMD